MPIKSSITIEETVGFLNELLMINPVAINSLFSMRASCNKKMADHPTADYADGQIIKFRLNNVLMGVEIKKLELMAQHHPFSYGEIKDAYLYCNKNYETVERAIKQAQKFGLPLAILGLMTKLNLVTEED